MDRYEFIEKLRANIPSRKFEPHAYYSHAADSVFFFYQSVDQYYAERIDDFLTVYRDSNSFDLVGCQIKGVPDALKLFGSFGLEISGGQVQLSMIFFACFAAANSREEVKKFYVELGQAAKNTTISSEEFAECALA